MAERNLISDHIKSDVHLSCITNLAILVHLMPGFDFLKSRSENGLENFGDKLNFVHWNANKQKILRK